MVDVIDAFLIVLAYAAGIVTETVRSYFSDMLTDRRRDQEAKQKELEQFLSVVSQMPDLISEMKNDLSNPDNSLIREFFLTKRSLSLNTGGPAFIYYFDDHQGLQSKVHILENHGYIKDITPGSAPMYRMTEDFVRLLLAEPK
jgi:hypothetical protein